MPPRARPGEAIDPEELARVRDDLSRAVLGRPRAVPRVHGVPSRMVREVLAAFGLLLRYDAARGVSPERHLRHARRVWVEVEPRALRELRRAAGRIRELGLLPGDEWRAQPELEAWAEGVCGALDLEGGLASPGAVEEAKRRLRELARTAELWPPDAG